MIKDDNPNPNLKRKFINLILGFAKWVSALVKHNPGVYSSFQL